MKCPHTKSVNSLAPVALLALLAGCTTTPTEQPSVAAPPVTPAPAAPCVCPKISVPSGVVGEVEYALVGKDGPLQKARIDTGATTTSVGFAEITPFERDGKKWVKFSIRDRITGETYPFERAVVRTASIKRHGAGSVERPVVKLKITIGEIARDIEVSLADRDAFDYPVLIGRNFLDGNFVVDVGNRYLAAGGSEE
jgi:hypothetical protein